MKGTLHKTESGWQVWYHAKEDLFYGNTGVRILPLHPDDTIGIGQENLDIEFEIIKFPVPPTNGPVSNSISTYAKLIDQRPTTMKGGEGWDKILDKAIQDKATRPLTEDDAWLTMKEGDITVNFKPMPEFDDPKYPTRAEQLREQGWLEIDKAFSKYWTEYTDGDFSHFTAVEKAQRKIVWLKENYNPPTKKQDNDNT